MKTLVFCVLNDESLMFKIDTRGGSPFNGTYGDAPPERGTFFRLEVYERVLGFHALKYMKG